MEVYFAATKRVLSCFCVQSIFFIKFGDSILCINEICESQLCLQWILSWGCNYLRRCALGRSQWKLQIEIVKVFYVFWAHVLSVKKEKSERDDSFPIMIRTNEVLGL